MTFTSLQPIMERGAELLVQHAEESQTELSAKCAAGLQELSNSCSLYDASVKTGKEFIVHFKQELQHFWSVMNSDAAGGKESIADKAFGLLEDMVLFIREKSLRQGGVGISRAEADVIRYFEESGHWRPGDGSIITDTYYVKLPAGVLRDVLTEIEQKVAAVNAEK